MNNYLKAFKSIWGVGAIIGTLIPAYSFFAELDPPLLLGAGLITSALAAATVVLTYYYNPVHSHPNSRLPILVKLSIKAFLGFVILLVIYLVLLQWCTVVDPQTEKIRFQIGFGMADWSLTEKGHQWKAAHPDQNIQDWMLRMGAFRDKGPEIIWKPWTIYLSGSLMVLTFISTFVLWTLGWALLAKHKSMADQKA